MCGARSQDNRYINRQREFNKIFHYFNRKIYARRGLIFSSGRYGAYIKIHLVLSEAEIEAWRASEETQDASYRFPRRSEFSKSLHVDSMEDSRALAIDNSQAVHPKKKLIDDFLQHDIWNEDNSMDSGLQKRINELLMKEEEEQDWEEGSKNEFTGAELIEKEKQRIISKKVCAIRFDSEVSIVQSSNEFNHSPDSMSRRQRIGTALIAPITKMLFKEEKAMSRQDTFERKESTSKMTDLKASLLLGETESDFQTVIEFEPNQAKSVRHRISAFGLDKLKISTELPMPRVSEQPNEEIGGGHGDGGSYVGKTVGDTYQDPQHMVEVEIKDNMEPEPEKDEEIQKEDDEDYESADFYSVADFHTVENMSVATKTNAKNR